MYSNDILQQKESFDNFLLSIYSSYLTKFPSKGAKYEIVQLLMDDVMRFSKDENSINMRALYPISKCLRELIHIRILEMEDANIGKIPKAKEIINKYESVIKVLEELERMCING